MRAVVAAENPTVKGNAAMMGLLGGRWKGLTEEERAPFLQVCVCIMYYNG